MSQRTGPGQHPAWPGPAHYSGAAPIRVLTGMTEQPSVTKAKCILGAVADGLIRELVSYWLRIHPGDGLPGRQNFDPVDVPRLLPHLLLTDVHGPPYRFRARVVGTAVVEAIGKDFTGAYLDEALPGFADTSGAADRVDVVETGLPSYRCGLATMPFPLDFAPIERVYLPFASDGRKVDLILAGMVYLVSSCAGSKPAPGGCIRLSSD